MPANRDNTNPAEGAADRADAPDAAPVRMYGEQWMMDDKKRVPVPIDSDEDTDDVTQAHDDETRQGGHRQVAPQVRRRAELAYGSAQTADGAARPEAAPVTEAPAPEPVADTEDEPVGEVTDWQAMYEQEHDKYLRAVAELQNYRRRVASETQQQRKFANEGLLCDLLPVTDNCNQALEAIRSAGDADAVARGVTMILDQLIGFIEQNGVTRIDPRGEQFDAALHEAVEAVPTSEVAENTIVEVVQPGYMLHERLLRPAKVRVAVSPT
ncbi:MAG TPA: nucleotide exchange factor GrpE [Armatimonadetes bacterium]|nr:nucleotide exchange factor GrpE [Armatimonadota bacterium]